MQITWKGTSSANINGLLITNTPHITKPRLRVNETYIDGRDGSIIEPLGYEAYDKEITIGLRGNFDIDEVVNYFTGSGELIISNEPDKCYTATIINQIDYEHLLRFRTATVVFRCQPYKHSFNESAITIATTGTYVPNASRITMLPAISVEGTGFVEIKLNNTTIFGVQLEEETSEVLYIDCENQTVTDELHNSRTRDMTGEFLELDYGSTANKISYSADNNNVVVKIYPRTRWL